ncbi:cytochrome P450 [Dentipellis sp. KUC8613]|nr:cytochrome P450 [Dentipellis sp. KUC8613]
MALTDVVSLPVVSAACLLSLGFFYMRRRAHNSKLPPGPTGYPFIGSILDVIKAECPQVLFTAWSRQYGEMVQFNVLGFNNVIVNKLSVANELLEKRGAIYSDRPNMILENEILGWDAAMPTMRYGNQFRKHRRLSQALLNPTAARGYTLMHEELSGRLLSALKTQPEKFRDTILIYATSTIFRLAYDLDITSDEHHLVKSANKAVRQSAEAYQAAGALVDVFPRLKWFYTSYPDWAPFAGFKKSTAAIAEEVVRANGVPYEMAKGKIRDGSARPSLVNDAINSLGGLDGISAEDEWDLRGLAGILYGAGQDTTLATLTSFIMAMAHSPDAQRKAQEEIDAVIGNDRLPTLDDRPDIPYLEAFIKEVYRWACPLAIAIPHAVIQDDVYNGYFIPKGTSIIASIYDMVNACPRPTEFLPHRFVDGTDLGEVPSDPRDVIFGFGRRRCPGLHVADNSVWTAIAQMLSSFDILPELVDGKEVPPALKWGKEITRIPEPFMVRIVPREGRKHLLPGN